MNEMTFLELRASCRRERQQSTLRTIMMRCDGANSPHGAELEDQHSSRTGTNGRTRGINLEEDESLE